MTNEIVIKMNNPNEPPKITLNGKKIKGIVDLEYKYDTRTDKTNGQHNFSVRYCDKDALAVRTAEVQTIMEG